MEGLPVETAVPSDPLPPEHPINAMGIKRTRVTMDAVRWFLFMAIPLDLFELAIICFDAFVMPISLHKPYQKLTG